MLHAATANLIKNRAAAIDGAAPYALTLDPTAGRSDGAKRPLA